MRKKQVDKTALFKGLKIVEMASVLAGPAAGMFFAELGAEVIKIENPSTGGDVTRQWKIPGKKSKISPYYTSVNWGKKVVFLNLSLEQNHRKLLGLIAKADILLLNFKQGDAEKFGLEYQQLSKMFPRLIYAHITGYGTDDPRTAYDLVLQAETGFMSMNGTPQSGPLKMPVAMIDLLASHQLKEGILTALLVRERTGKGSAVHVSLQDTAVASLAYQASNYLLNGSIPGLEGSLHPNIAPYGETFTCSDGKQIVLAVGNDRQFENLCNYLKMSELYKDKRFATNEKRIANRKVLYAILQKSIAMHPSGKIWTGLLRNRVPCGRIRNLKEVFDNKKIKASLLPGNRDSEWGKCVQTAVFSLISNT